jgi:hypothetical protein
MAQVDDLDEGLAQLAQLFADLGLVVNIMRARIAAVDRLREPLKAELLDMQAAIDQVLPLL